MEISTTIFQNFQFNLSELVIACLIFGVIGYRLALRKTRRLRNEIRQLEKEILDLNESLLFEDNGVPVIKIKQPVKNGLAR